ncbi:trypsin-like peptidase domain-containing protein [Hydrogenophaga sp.]|uniref:trypsin-like peptidase domain-containing protein n=1 Tax=Hydrogenophaga sp. TaxID=1904254 RepID=UPI002737439D|nr:trypsin-like peptidase domain-containing protein [Hydrogenophaga sp.]MDP1780357.1 trypsin-like peptidase domain-containing protein [Hydrogenophaga sp.]MDP3351064.1 trypsin-like peptidase domain-containing protein [Hydrogenophaga sp.]MDZ4398907.1 trypsin-like peptidase domain-containing protein [Hydrogenophaga sp.]
MKSQRWPLTVAVLVCCALTAVQVEAEQPRGVAAALPGGFTPNYRAIVERAGPAVVEVDVVGMRTPTALEWDPDNELPALPFKGKLPFHGQGSGFIISRDGLVLTSAHVIQGARSITVRLSDRRQFRAQVLGIDATTDVAVLRVDAKDLPVLRMGRVDLLQVGDPVVTIGSPFGLEQSVSHGIVSAKGRALPGFAAVPHIQTDVPVNPGHSGGPLLDASASVVGINSQIHTLSGGYQGLSFAVPIDLALRVKDEIVAHGRMRHGYLGVAVQSLDITLARAFGLGHPRGALVAGVEAGSAAEKGGLRAGDIITGFKGETLAHAGELTSHLGVALAGERVRLTVWRARKALEVVVQLDEALPLEDAQAPDTAPMPQGQQELGWTLRPLTALEHTRLGVPGGLQVEAVSALTAQAGLLAGDALLAINHLPVHSLDEVRRLLHERPLDAALLVDRDGERIYLPLALE